MNHGDARSFSLKYGSGRIELSAPGASLRGVHGLASLGLGTPTVGAAGDAPGESRDVLARGGAELLTNGFADAARGKTLALLVDDATRSEPRVPVFAAIAPFVRLAARVRIFVCTGTHEPDLPENRALATQLEQLAAEHRFPNASVHVHDSRIAAAHRLAATTSRGVEVWVDRASDDAGLFLVVSDMKTHYFAGYSNPVKNFVPGICAFETARGNHAMALQRESTYGAHPFHPDPARREHALAADMVEGMNAILGARRAFAFAFFSSGSEIRWCGAGDLAEAASRGIAFVDRSTTLRLEPTDRLVVSAGGFPFDESLYTAQRALELTKRAVKPGGEVLFLAECRNGIGPPEAHSSFFAALARPLPEVLRSLGARYEMYSHKAYKFAEMLLSLRAVHVHSTLDPQSLASAHLTPAADPQLVLDRWAAESPAVSIQAIDDASKLVVT